MVQISHRWQDDPTIAAAIAERDALAAQLRTAGVQPVVSSFLAGNSAGRTLRGANNGRREKTPAERHAELCVFVKHLREEFILQGMRNDIAAYNAYAHTKGVEEKEGFR